MDLIGTARPRLDFSHLAKAGKISWIARLPKPTTAQPNFLPGGSGTASLLRQGFLQQHTGNIRHNQSLPEFGHETAGE